MEEIQEKNSSEASREERGVYVQGATSVMLERQENRPSKGPVASFYDRETACAEGQGYSSAAYMPVWQVPSAVFES